MDEPVLKPDLNLPRAETGDFSRKSLPVGSVRMWLFDEFTHEESRLLMRQPASSVSRRIKLQEVPHCQTYLNRFIFRRAAVRSAAV